MSFGWAVVQESEAVASAGAWMQVDRRRGRGANSESRRYDALRPRNLRWVNHSPLGDCRLVVFPRPPAQKSFDDSLTRPPPAFHILIVTSIVPLAHPHHTRPHSLGSLTIRLFLGRSHKKHQASPIRPRHHYSSKSTRRYSETFWG